MLPQEGHDLVDPFGRNLQKSSGPCCILLESPSPAETAHRARVIFCIEVALGTPLNNNIDKGEEKYDTREGSASAPIRCHTVFSIVVEGLEVHVTLRSISVRYIAAVMEKKMLTP